MTEPTAPRSIREAWDSLSDAAAHLEIALAEVRLVEGSLSDEWFAESEYRTRLIETERFLMSEGYRRIDLHGNWTKEPLGEAS